MFNTDLLYTIELGHGLNVAECMAHSAIARKESRGAHQRLDEGCTERDDVNFLKHTLAFREADGTTRLEYGDVKITTLPPANVSMAPKRKRLRRRRPPMAEMKT